MELGCVDGVGVVAEEELPEAAEAILATKFIVPGAASQ